MGSHLRVVPALKLWDGQGIAMAESVPDVFVRFTDTLVRYNLNILEPTVAHS